jgi:hypothetical protein
MPPHAGPHPTIKDGYVFGLKLNRPDGYTLVADPVDRASGTNHFYLDSASTQIHVNSEGPADPNDPVM